MILEGEVIEGFNTSNIYIKRYYDKLYKLIRRDYYPHTINLKLEQEDFKQFKLRSNLFIEGDLILHWKKGNLKGFSCICLIPEKTKHRFVVEIICEKKVEISKKLEVEVD